MARHGMQKKVFWYSSVFIAVWVPCNLLIAHIAYTALDSGINGMRGSKRDPNDEFFENRTNFGSGPRARSEVTTHVVKRKSL